MSIIYKCYQRNKIKSDKRLFSAEKGNNSNSNINSDDDDDNNNKL